MKTLIAHLNNTQFTTLKVNHIQCYEAGKRLLDVLGALFALVLLWPILASCMIWIKSIDNGPIFYKQWRVGQDGFLFRIYKFRTMSIDAESDGAAFAQCNDPRVLFGCQWMRKSHIDELPQLINIFLGQMSLVGPRPERPEVFTEYQNALPEFTQRLNVKPGLTGLAQITNGYTSNLNGMKQKLSYDLNYIEKRSFFGDLKLILQTLPKFWDSSAC